MTIIRQYLLTLALLGFRCIRSGSYTCGLALATRSLCYYYTGSGLDSILLETFAPGLPDGRSIIIEHPRSYLPQPLFRFQVSPTSPLPFHITIHTICRPHLQWHLDLSKISKRSRSLILISTYPWTTSWPRRAARDPHRNHQTARVPIDLGATLLQARHHPPATAR